MTTSKSNPVMSLYGKVKSTASRVAGKINGNKRQISMRFYRENGMWYADVPNWPGPKAMLLMVDGADIFLANLSYPNSEFTLDISLDPVSGYSKLDYVHPHPSGDGAYYTTPMDGQPHKLWLCGVTEFVFGYMPEGIWYN